MRPSAHSRGQTPIPASSSPMWLHLASLYVSGPETPPPDTGGRWGMASAHSGWERLRMISKPDHNATNWLLRAFAPSWSPGATM